VTPAACGRAVDERAGCCSVAGPGLSAGIAAIAAVVIGGASFLGGRGTVTNALVGAR